VSIGSGVAAFLSHVANRSWTGIGERAWCARLKRLSACDCRAEHVRQSLIGPSIWYVPELADG